MFWLGFGCGFAAWFVVAIVLFVWLTRSGDLVDDGPDEHADVLGIGAADGHFGTGQ